MERTEETGFPKNMRNVKHNVSEKFSWQARFLSTSSRHFSSNAKNTKKNKIRSPSKGVQLLKVPAKQEINHATSKRGAYESVSESVQNRNRWWVWVLALNEIPEVQSCWPPCHRRAELHWHWPSLGNHAEQIPVTEQTIDPQGLGHRGLKEH